MYIWPNVRRRLLRMEIDAPRTNGSRISRRSKQVLLRSCCLMLLLRYYVEQTNCTAVPVRLPARSTFVLTLECWNDRGARCDDTCAHERAHPPRPRSTYLSRKVRLKTFNCRESRRRPRRQNLRSTVLPRAIHTSTTSVQSIKPTSSDDASSSPWP